jgi:hypothetical protein
MTIVFIRATVDKCPECTRTLDFHVLSLCSNIGSPVTVCRWCGARVNSGRLEWSDMTSVMKAWFLAVSGVYVALVGILGGYSVDIARGLWLGEPLNKVPDFLGAVFLTAFTVWGSLVLLLQGWRVATSIHRSKRAYPHPSHGFWNLQTWVQMKVGLLLIMGPLAAWLLRILRDA